MGIGNVVRIEINMGEILENKIEHDIDNNNVETKLVKDIGTDYSFKRQIVWFNAIGFLILHIICAVGYYVGIFHAKWSTWIWAFFVFQCTAQGVTMGAHRLFTHRTFKATPLLRAIMLVFFTAAGQNCIYVWARDHRLHHKYSDTDADPHNSRRGFFFSHIGWLMSKKHPKIMEYGKSVDMSDLEADWMVMFQKDYYFVLYLIFAIFIPVFVPVYFFGEDFTTALLLCYFARYVSLLHGTWLINSAAHFFGTRPYDKNQEGVETKFASFLTNGEGWHNYHHAFPWDYKAAELGTEFNGTATLIRFCERIGMAYELKNADGLVRSRIMRTGDGTHQVLGTDEGKSTVRAVIGPVTPMNPFYTSKPIPTGL